MSMEICRCPPRSQQLEAQQLEAQQLEAQQMSQEMTDLSLEVEEIAGDSVPPNGGLKAWLQVLGGFLVIFNAQ